MHGFPDVTTNGFGGSDSWGGNFRLFEADTGTAFIAYCIERAVNYPFGIHSANNGFSEIEDIPALRGVSQDQRMALSWALWKYGDTSAAGWDELVGSDNLAGAMFLVTHVMSNDDPFWTYNSGVDRVIENVAMGPDWPNGAAIKDLAVNIVNQSYANRGPWAVDVTLGDPVAGAVPGTITLTGPGGPIANETVSLSVTNGSGHAATLITNSAGQATFTTTIVDPTATMTAAVEAEAPGYYRVMRGRVDTQAVITTGKPVTITNSTFRQFSAPYDLEKTTDNPAYQTGYGAEFDLYDGPTATGTPLARLVVGIDGAMTTDPLPPGQYTLVERIAPRGQLLNPTPITVTLGLSDPTSPTITNVTVKTAALTIHKLDEHGAYLPGATIEVRFDADNDGTFETLIETHTSTDQPHTVDGLPVGNYQVIETIPAPGHTLGNISQQHVQFLWGTDETTDELDADVTFTNLRPIINTQIVDPDGKPITHTDLQAHPDHDNSFTADLIDEARLTNVADSTTGEIEFVAYGPYPSLDVAVCDPDDEAGRTIRTTVGSGTFTSDPVQINQAGVYTFVATWTGSDGATVSHDCGMIEETVVVNPVINTVAEGDNLITGHPDFELRDLIDIGGVPDGHEGTIVVTAYGPFNTVDPEFVCEPATSVHTVTFTAAGSGRFASPLFPANAFSQRGLYTFVAEWFGAENASRTHDCGLAEETVTVLPRIETKISDQDAYIGGDLFDTAVLAGVGPDEPGKVYLTAYGPFNAGEAMVCTPEHQAVLTVIAPSDRLFDPDTLEPLDTTGPVRTYGVVYPTVGDGEFPSPTVRIEGGTRSEGYYTFMERWVSDEDPTVEVEHDCGDEAETTYLRAPVTITGVKHNVADRNELIAGAVYDVFIKPDSNDATVTPPLDADWFADTEHQDAPAGTRFWGRSELTDRDGEFHVTVPTGFEWCVQEVSAPTGWILDQEIRCTDDRVMDDTTLHLPQRKATDPPVLPRTGPGPRILVPVTVAGALAGMALIRKPARPGPQQP